MSKIIVALDGMSQKEALKLAETLKGLVWGFKVNDLLFEDPKIINKLKKFGKVFADAKLHDIPNTVANMQESRPGLDTRLEAKNSTDETSSHVHADKTGRNDPCPCGAKHPDGRPVKYKHCHGA